MVDIDTEINKEIDKIISKIVFSTHAEIVRNTPVAKSSPGNEFIESHTGGRLRRSIVIEKDSDGNWFIGTNVPYAEFVEENTKPHVIQPKNKKALAFYSHKGGNFVVTKKVHHPGTTGAFMFKNGVTHAETEIKRHFR